MAMHRHTLGHLSPPNHERDAQFFVVRFRFRSGLRMADTKHCKVVLFDFDETLSDVSKTLDKAHVALMEFLSKEHPHLDVSHWPTTQAMAKDMHAFRGSAHRVQVFSLDHSTVRSQ
eukprot:gene7518-7032_t